MFDGTDEHVPDTEPDFFEQHKSVSGNDLSASLAKVAFYYIGRARNA